VGTLSSVCQASLLERKHLSDFLIPVGPIVTSEKARTGELDISLLERLFERPVYADHAHARSKIQNIALDLQSPTFIPFTNLTKVCTRHYFVLTLYSMQVSRIIEVTLRY
jgi:hypothetical protein